MQQLKLHCETDNSYLSDFFSSGALLFVVMGCEFDFDAFFGVCAAVWPQVAQPVWSRGEGER